MRDNVKFTQMPRPVPRPIPFPTVDIMFLVGWWVILAVSAAFWYWFGSILGIVG